MRDALVGDGDTAVVQEAIDRVHDTYYRQIPKSALADDAIAGVVAKLGDRFSNYFDPAQYKRFKDAQNSEFSGVGLQVSRHPKGLRVDAVYDGSPAKRAGLRQGDVIVAADGHRPRRALAAGIRRPGQGAAGQRGAPHLGPRRQDATRRPCRARRSPCRSSPRSCAPRGGCQVGVVRLSQFSSGAHAEVYAALRKLQKRGAKVFVLDLRDNGGGLVSEAQLIASAFLKDGPIVTTRGRAVKEQTLRATGDPVVPTAPMSVLVNGDTASASEIVTGALQDRDRAKVVGTETFGKGVFQEVLELSNGGALDITAGQYFTPKGRNLGGKGVSHGQGDHPRRPGQGRPQDEDRRGARPGDGRRRRQVPVLTDAPPRVVLLEQRGRFLVGEPFFQRGRRATVERSRDARPGRLALLHPNAKGGRFKIARVLGRPDVARDVIEALMLDRGLRRSFPAGVERAAAGRAAARRRPPRPHGPADLHHRPRHRPRLRRRDLVRGARRRALARLGPHRRRLGLRAPGRRGRPRGLPALDLGLRARRGRADAARGAVQRRLLAAPGRRPSGRHRRARAARGARRSRRPSTAR